MAEPPSFVSVPMVPLIPVALAAPEDPPRVCACAEPAPDVPEIVAWESSNIEPPPAVRFAVAPAEVTNDPPALGAPIRLPAP